MPVRRGESWGVAEPATRKLQTIKAHERLQHFPCIALTHLPRPSRFLDSRSFPTLYYLSFLRASKGTFVKGSVEESYPQCPARPLAPPSDQLLEENDTKSILNNSIRLPGSKIND